MSGPIFRIDQSIGLPQLFFNNLSMKSEPTIETNDANQIMQF